MGKDGELCATLNTPWNKVKIDLQPLKGYLVRNIKIGNDSVTWKPFCVLPNVDGQQYTLGESFISQEEQGEFIFLRNQKNRPTGNLGCEIHVENEKYFVTPFDKDPGVFINDVQVLEKTELKFGDYLFLGGKCKKLLFAERQLCPSDTEDNAVTDEGLDKETKSDEEFAPVQNGLILSHILSYLPVADTKRCRLVSRLWNEEALKIVRKRCQVEFDFDDAGYHKPRTSMKIFRYDVEMKHIPMPNWMIKLPSFKKFYIKQQIVSSYTGQPGAKFLVDFNSLLFKPYLQNIKQLEIGGPICTVLEFSLYSKLLQAVQGTLQELKVVGKWYLTQEEGRECEFPKTINFPNLRSFTMSLNNIYDTGTNLNLIWLPNFLHGITRVGSIHLSDDASLVLVCLESINKISSSFSCLEELSVSDLNLDMLKILLQLKLKKPLKKLGLGEPFECRTKEDIAMFEQLILKYAPTLEKLTFWMPQRDEDEDEEDLPFFIRFPAFPSLKYLGMSWDDNYDYEVMGLVFPGGVINYEKDFPSLKFLVLGPPCGIGIYEAFFPPIKATDPGIQPTEVCNTVNVLKIFGGKRHYQVRGSFTKPMIKAIAAMFPNASNSDWIKWTKKYEISGSDSQSFSSSSSEESEED